MKILYAIQGTGNGHITRAAHFLPLFREYGQVDVLLSGKSNQLTNAVPIDLHRHGLGFTFGKKGGIDYVATYKKNKVRRFWNEVKTLEVEQYDLVISDFEPVSAWACQRKKVPCIGLSNQVSLLNKSINQVKSDDLAGKLIIKHYAPCSHQVGLFYESNHRNVFYPVIRDEIKALQTNEDGSIIVYLPSYKLQRVIHTIEQLNDRKHHWKLFSKQVSTPTIVSDYISVHPVRAQQFIHAMAQASGVITAAGFGTTSEALYLGKKLLVVPQKNQYEQACNAAYLKKMGVNVLKSFKKKRTDEIKDWLADHKTITPSFPDQSKVIVSAVFNYAHAQ